MGEVPSLFALCMDAAEKEIIHGGDILSHVYQLPSDLFDLLLLQLPPLALHMLQEEQIVDYLDDHDSAVDCFRNHRKRKRSVNFEAAWMTLFKSRWPDNIRRTEPVVWLPKQDASKCELTNDWQQMYWETHLQNCLDEAAEIALLPSFDGCISAIQISDAITKSIGHKGHMTFSTCDYSKLSYHFQKFGSYARCLRIQNVLCTAETCLLLKNSKLQGLELRWIKSKEHVDGLCRLLNQNRETLKSLEFIHCKLCSFVDAICDSLQLKGLQTHGIQHFSIKTSSILGTELFPFPAGLASFLSSGKSLSSLNLCDDHLGKKFAKMIFSTLLDASSTISSLDLSENNISGWLSSFEWRSSNCPQLSLGMDKSLQSLRVLNLRGNNLREDDVESLKYALVYMPNLENLDISDNPIADDGIRSLIPCFAEMSERHYHFTDLKVENCDLSCNGVNQLLEVLSTLKAPLNSLSIGDNDLGRKVGASLGKYLGTGIRVINIEDIGLGSSGFLEVQKELLEELKLVYINISKNRGGIETAKFLSKLISCAPDLVAINAGYNLMPVESVPDICSALKVAKGKLQRLDLTGNTLCTQTAGASLLAEFQIKGKPIVVLPLLALSNAAYDDDP